MHIQLELEFVPNYPVRVNDNNFNNDITGTRGNYQAGISATPALDSYIYASINCEKGDGMESPWTGNAGLKTASNDAVELQR